MIESARELVTALEPLANSTLIASIASAAIGVVAALWTVHRQTKERIGAEIVWNWAPTFQGEGDVPFLIVQNQNAQPIQIVSARFLQGSFLRTEAVSYALEWADLGDRRMPKSVDQYAVHHFRLAESTAAKIASEATPVNRWLGMLGRNYVWLEVRTMGGSRFVLPANDVTPWKDRPMWLDGGWWRKLRL